MPLVCTILCNEPDNEEENSTMRHYKCRTTAIYSPGMTRLTRERVAQLRAALLLFEKHLAAELDYEGSRAVRHIRTTLPTHVPYDVWFHPHEWPLVSRALRPVQRPAKGTPEMQWRGLHQTLLSKGYGRAGK